jgi:hypothetical protein
VELRVSFRLFRGVDGGVREGDDGGKVRRVGRAVDVRLMSVFCFVEFFRYRVDDEGGDELGVDDRLFDK